MPFDGDFWKGKAVSPNWETALGGIKGFAVALPYAWTMGENNDMRLNNTLVTEAKPNLPAENTTPENREGSALAFVKSARGSGSA